MRELTSKIPGAENFTYGELIRSEAALRHNLPNFPHTEQEWQNLEYLARNLLQPLREALGPVRINSGYRSPEVNAKVGGSPTSYHCLGCAADIELMSVSLLTGLEYVYKNLPFSEMIAEYWKSGWVHVALMRGRENERALKLKDKNHNYERVSLEYLQDIWNRY